MLSMHLVISDHFLAGPVPSLVVISRPETEWIRVARFVMDGDQFPDFPFWP